MSQPIIKKEYFTYQAVGPVGAGGAQTFPINFEANASFVWLKTTLVASRDAELTENTKLVPAATVFIRDTGSGSNLMQEPIDINSLAGDAELPYMLPVGYEVKPNSTLTFDIENLDPAATYNRLGLVLHGFKVYRAG